MNSPLVVLVSLGLVTCSSSTKSGPAANSGAGGSGTVGNLTTGATTSAGASTQSGGATSNGGATVSTGDSVLAHHKNPTRDGVYVQPTFTKAALASLHVDTTFSTGALQGPVYAQPLFVDGGTSGTDLLIVASESNDVYAFNAKTGAQAWMKNLGAPVPLSKMPCGNIDPYGITGTPVIDLASRALFVDAMTTPDGGTTKKHMIFALSIDDGSTKSGWPIDVGATLRSGSTQFNNPPQSERGALAILNGTLYVPFGGLYGDCGNYHGWLAAISIGNPAQVQAWATPSGGGGAWSPGGVSSDGTHVYIATGNTIGATTWGGGEAILQFTPGTSFANPAYWAPSNWKALDNGDVDIGGSNPMIVDLQGATPSQLVLSLGKDGNAYLIDRNNWGGVSSPLATAHVCTSEIITAAAVYSTSQATYAAFKGSGAICTSGSGDLTTIKLVAGSPPGIAGSWCAKQNGMGSPMVTTTDGHAEAVVWSLGSEGDSLLHGFDGDTGAAVFAGAAKTITGMHRFNTPIAAKGRIFVAADSGVVAFTL